MHFTAQHMQETFELFRQASPLLHETKLELRQSSQCLPDEVLLRDVELELP
jgi:hypothetical protein